jgi:ABC-2 type transport system ATP-binding protein
MVTLRVQGPEDGIGGKLKGIPIAKSVQRASESDGVVTFDIAPAPKVARGELAAAVFELATREKWKVRDLHTEEGRLDEVFRNITIGDAASKQESERRKGKEDQEEEDA